MNHIETLEILIESTLMPEDERKNIMLEYIKLAKEDYEELKNKLKQIRKIAK